jgi:hypothetical protein
MGKRKPEVRTLTDLLKEAVDMPGYGRWRDFLLENGVDPALLGMDDEPVYPIEWPQV